MCIRDRDTQRAFAGARWDLRGLTGLGQEVTLTALVRGDVYPVSYTHLDVYKRQGLALADRKSDNVGRRIDLRDKLNVHLLTLLCDD